MPRGEIGFDKCEIVVHAVFFSLHVHSIEGVVTKQHDRGLAGAIVWEEVTNLLITGISSLYA